MVGAVAANSLTSAVANAASPDTAALAENESAALATQEGPQSIPLYGQYQAGIATAQQTAATFLSFDVTAAANPAELTDLFRTLTARGVPDRGGKSPHHRPERASQTIGCSDRRYCPTT